MAIINKTNDIWGWWEYSVRGEKRKKKECQCKVWESRLGVCAEILNLSGIQLWFISSKGGMMVTVWIQESHVTIRNPSACPILGKGWVLLKLLLRSEPFLISLRHLPWLETICLLLLSCFDYCSHWHRQALAIATRTGLSTVLASWCFTYKGTQQ